MCGVLILHKIYKRYYYRNAYCGDDSKLTGAEEYKNIDGNQLELY